MADGSYRSRRCGSRSSARLRSARQHLGWARRRCAAARSALAEERVAFARASSALVGPPAHGRRTRGPRSRRRWPRRRSSPRRRRPRRPSPPHPYSDRQSRPPARTTAKTQRCGMAKPIIAVVTQSRTGTARRTHRRAWRRRHTPPWRWRVAGIVRFAGGERGPHPEEADQIGDRRRPPQRPARRAPAGSASAGLTMPTQHTTTVNASRVLTFTPPARGTPSSLLRSWTWWSGPSSLEAAPIVPQRGPGHRLDNDTGCQKSLSGKPDPRRRSTLEALPAPRAAGTPTQRRTSMCQRGFEAPRRTRPDHERLLNTW